MRVILNPPIEHGGHKYVEAEIWSIYDNEPTVDKVAFIYVKADGTWSKAHRTAYRNDVPDAIKSDIFQRAAEKHRNEAQTHMESAEKMDRMAKRWKHP